jgi:peptide deformylase
MFNPKVISASEELFESEEGCLSFPDLWIPVKRPIKIEAGYVDKLGKDCIITLTGIDARCFLHELDHLDGICFIEKVSPLKLAMARKKQQKRKYNG